MFSLWFITANSNYEVATKTILWLGVTRTWGTVLKGHSGRKVENHCPDMFGFKSCSSLPPTCRQLGVYPFPSGGREDRHRQPNLVLLLQKLTAARPGVVLLSRVREKSPNDKWRDGCVCSQQCWFYRQEKCPSNDRGQDNGPVCLGEEHTLGPTEVSRHSWFRTHGNTCL